MTVCYALASGNWSNPGTWSGGAVPGPGDDAYANGKTIAIDLASVTVNSLQNVALGSPVVLATGGFTISVACALTVSGGILHAHIDGTVDQFALISISAGSHAVSVNAPSIEAGNSTTVFHYALRAVTGYTGALSITAGRIIGGERGFAVEINQCGALTINADLYGCDNIGGIGNGYGVRVNGSIPSLTIVGDVRSATEGNPGHTGYGITTSSGITIGNTIFTGSVYGYWGNYSGVFSHNGPLTLNINEGFSTTGWGFAVQGSGATTIRIQSSSVTPTGGLVVGVSGAGRIVRTSGTFSGRFPISGPYCVIAGEPFSFQLTDDATYPTGNVLTYRSGGGTGTEITVPGNSAEISSRSSGMLFGIDTPDADTVLLGMPAVFDDLGDPDLFAAQLNYVFGNVGVEEDGWLTVTARAVQFLADTADAGSVPDYVSASGSVLFTPNLSKPIRRLSTDEFLAVSSVLATLNIHGELSYDGIEDVRIIAPLWDDLSNTAWTWTATFQPAPGQSWSSFSVSFTGAPGAVINLGSLVG